MFDIFKWSLPIARVFGTEVRIHLAYPLLVVPMVLRFSIQLRGPWNDSIAVAAHHDAVDPGSRIRPRLRGPACRRRVGRDPALAARRLARATICPNAPRRPLHFALGGPLVNIAILLVSIASSSRSVSRSRSRRRSIRSGAAGRPGRRSICCRPGT